MRYPMLHAAFARIALLGVGLVTLPACADILGAESSPELSATCMGTIRVRITTDDTGATSDVAPAYSHGVYDYLRYLNDSQGGILGCPIDVIMKDTSYDPVKTEQQVDAWRQTPEWAEVSTLFIFGTGPAARVSEKATADHKILIPGSYAGSFATPDAISKDVNYPDINASGASIQATEHKASPGYPYLFYPATDYSTGIRIALQAVWKVAPGRIVMVHETADKCAYCVEPLAAGKSYALQLPGMQLGPDLIVHQTADVNQASAISQTVADYVQQEITRKKADSTYVPVSWFWVGNTLVSASLVGKAVGDAQKLIDDAFPSLNPPWKLRVMVNNWGIGERVSSICGDSCEDIYYGLFPVPRYGDVQNSEGMNLLLRIHDTYRSKDKQSADLYRDVPYVQGYAAAVMWRKAVERAVQAGHNTPTGDDLKNAFEAFKDMDLEGMTAGSVSFNPKDHRPQSDEAIYKLNSQNTLEYVDHYSVKLDPDWLGY